MLFLEAGGACWDAVTCAFLPTATYDFDVGDDDHPERRGGVFDAAEAANPLADYSVVYVPYCTGDVHLGDTARDYLPVLTVAHRGAPNAGAALDHLVAEFADAEHVLVAGESAGAIASPLYGGLAADRLPRARVTVLADGAGAYPDVPFVNGLLGRAWGVLGAVPDWPENERAPVEEWSFPSLWVRAGRHDPSIVMARFDFASDDVQQSLTPLSGMLPGDIASLLADNENTIEAAGVEQLSYTAPGDGHTVLGSDTFYTLEVDGVALVDWVGALVAGAELSDVPADESRRRR